METTTNQEVKYSLGGYNSAELICELERRGYTGTLRKKREQKPPTELVNGHFVRVKEI